MLHEQITLTACCQDFFFFFFFLQLQKHDREDEDVPSKWRTEAEMAAEASDLRDRLKDL